jgi:hypothetical protein
MMAFIPTAETPGLGKSLKNKWNYSQRIERRPRTTACGLHDRFHYHVTDYQCSWDIERMTKMHLCCFFLIHKAIHHRFDKAEKTCVP